ncbi:MAG: DUF1579 family protein [Planctomycetota bacterium]|jgi:hypothetical protein
MNNRTAIVLVAVVATAFFLGQVVAQEKEQGQGMPPMPEWMKPTAEHAALAKSVGDFIVEGEHFMAPGAPGVKFAGTAKRELILNGLFIRETFRSTAANQPFEGMLLQGYDTIAKGFFTIWMDSMSPVPSIGRGKEENGLVTIHGTAPGYMTGKMKKTKSTMQDGGEDRSVFTMYDVKDDGTEFMTMRLTYIRKK